MDKIKDSGSLAQGSIPCGFTILCHILLIFKIWHIFLHNNCATILCILSTHCFFKVIANTDSSRSQDSVTKSEPGVC